MRGKLPPPGQFVHSTLAWNPVAGAPFATPTAIYH
jgi:hypothetical protein